MGKDFICADPEPEPGMVCEAGPDGCGMCIGQTACNLQIPEGWQDWSHLNLPAGLEAD